MKSRIDLVEMRYLKSKSNFTLFVKDIEESSSEAVAASSKVWRFVLYVVVFVVVGYRRAYLDFGVVVVFAYSFIRSNNQTIN